MNKIDITEDQLLIIITGWDRIWSFKRKIKIPLKNIKKVYPYKGNVKPPFWRFPGTAIPKVIISGTYYGKKRKEFWNTHFQREGIVIDLKNHEYTRIVIDVKNIDEIMRKLSG